MTKHGNVWLPEERVVVAWHGEWSDIIRKKMPDGSIQEVYTPWKKNKVVSGAGAVIAACLASASGISFHALGSGQAAWDASIPAPLFGDTTLETEFFRKPPESISNINEITGTAQSGSQTTLVDTVLAESDDFYNFLELKITAGTNSGESRLITDYDSGTGTATVKDPFTAAIDNTSVYEINVPVVADTNKIQVLTRFKFSDSGANGTIREQGLFGGAATVALDSGSMLNEIRHPKIEKDNTVELVRRIRIKFTIIEV